MSGYAGQEPNPHDFALSDDENAPEDRTSKEWAPDNTYAAYDAWANAQNGIFPPDEDITNRMHELAVLDGNPSWSAGHWLGRIAGAHYAYTRKTGGEDKALFLDLLRYHIAFDIEDPLERQTVVQEVNGTEIKVVRAVGVTTNYKIALEALTAHLRPVKVDRPSLS